MTALTKIRQSGFTLKLVDGYIELDPFSKLTPKETVPRAAVHRVQHNRRQADGGGFLPTYRKPNPYYFTEESQ